MRILGIKEGHDGGIALIDDRELVFCLEAEKDSFVRCSEVTAELFHRAASLAAAPPDVIAIGGWVKGTKSHERQSLSGYFGTGPGSFQLFDSSFFGSPVKAFSSTHERSHIWNAYGMAPFPQGEPCHILVWEGNIGNFYTVDTKLHIHNHGRVLTDPGNKYTFLYSLADAASPSRLGFWDTSHPGKLMALAAYGHRGRMTPDEHATADFILSRDPIMTTTTKDDLLWSPIHNVGIETQAFKDMAAKFTDVIFDQFYKFAVERLRGGLPLLIAGGCGLNCEWNSKWRDSGLFSDVFVPPCCNDSGSAVGTAVDAMRELTGNAKLSWTVYAGEEFIRDCEPSTAMFIKRQYDPCLVADLIASGGIIAWVEGRYEIGPRALGHRSLLAEPFNRSTRDRLNRIKQRESFRPIAPICLNDDVAREFDPDSPSPHMLYFYHVKNSALKAVTHVDGSARVQTVTREAAPRLETLLREFRQRTGTSVLCNTSLNFHHRGFINRMSDLAEYCYSKSIDAMVVNGELYQLLQNPEGGH